MIRDLMREVLYKIVDDFASQGYESVKLLDLELPKSFSCTVENNKFSYNVEALESNEEYMHISISMQMEGDKSFNTIRTDFLMYGNGKVDSVEKDDFRFE